MSAHDGRGFDDLLSVIGDRLRAMTTLVELAIPYDRGDVLAQVHREGQVLTEMASETGITVRARLDPDSVGRLAEWLTGASKPAAPEPDPWD